MVRKLALAVSIALGTVQVPAHALGLGELRSNSNLNQNFTGEIRLLSLAPAEIDTIRVGLADADAFEQAGVERLFFLSRLQFQPTLGADGNPVVRVTSDFPIREPFLNFLVEVNWPNGRLLREYSVLLDPPVTTRRRPPAVTQATRTGRPAHGGGAAASPDGGEYGPVQANETAWGVASQVRPAGVSMEQMMMALLNANPRAFIDGDINRLRRGQILRVPPIDEIQRLTRRQASAAFRAQEEAWLARRETPERPTPRTPVATAAPPPTPSTEEPAEDRLRIVTAEPEGEGPAGAGEDAETKAADADATADLEARLLAVRENAETSRQEAEALRSRLDEMDARLADMQRLLSLKDEQLAQLQARLADEPADEAPVAPPDAIPADAAAPIGAAPAEEMAGEIAEPASMVPTEAPAAGYRIEDIAPRVDPDRVVENWGTGTDGMASATDLGIPRQVDPDKIVMQAAAGDGQPADVAAEAPAPVEPVAKEVTASDSAPADTESRGDDASPIALAEVAPPSDPGTTAEPPAGPDDGSTGDGSTALDQTLAPYLALIEQNKVPAALGGGLLLLLIALAIGRIGKGKPDRRDELATPEGVRVPVGQTQTAARTAATAASVAGTRVEELTADDIASLADDEVDALAEADVYIAYGRYQQAEELLDSALRQQPDRAALRCKLLEVHYATRNGAAFVALAQKMADAGQADADPAAWSKICSMGRELDPNNALFGAAGRSGATAAAAATATAVAGSAALSEQDIAELNATPAGRAAASTTAPPSDSGISLEELDSFELELSSPGSSTDSTGLDGGLPLEPPSITNRYPSLDDDTATDDAPLDPNIEEYDIDQLQAELEELSDLTLPGQEQALGETGGGIRERGVGLVTEDPGPRQEGLDEPLDLTTAFDEAGFDEGRDEFAGRTPPSATAPAAAGDPATIKLEIARNYLDMGDSDGARAMLGQVIAEGNESQRSEAQRMLDGLG